MPRTRLWFSVLPSLCVAPAITGCAGTSASRPLGTSLHYLVTESDPQSGPALNHMGITSLAGLIPFPGTGLMYHYPRVGWLHQHTLPSSMAVGIARKQSFEMIGTVDAEEAKVKLLATKLATVQAAVEAAAGATVRRAALLERKDNLAKGLEASLAEAQKEAQGRGDALAAFVKEHPSGDAANAKSMAVLEAAVKSAQERVDVALGALNRHADASKNTGAELKDLIDQIKAADGDIATKDAAIATTQSDFQKQLLDSPGILVIRWKTREVENGSGSLGPVASGSSKRDDSREGYAVLGSIRVREIFFGEDLKRMWLNLSPEDRAVSRAASVASYCVQSKHIYYVAQGRFARELKESFEANVRDLTATDRLLAKIDKVKIDYYLSTLANLGNSGDLSGMKWAVREFDFSDAPSEMDSLRALVSTSNQEATQAASLLSGTAITEAEKQASGTASEFSSRVMVQNVPERSHGHGALSVPDQHQAEEPLYIPAQSGYNGWTTVDVVLTGIGRLASVWSDQMDAGNDVQIPLFSSDAAEGISTMYSQADIDLLNADVARINAMLLADRSYKQASAFVVQLKRLVEARRAFDHELSRVTHPARGREFDTSSAAKAVRSAVDAFRESVTTVHKACGHGGDDPFRTGTPAPASLTDALRNWNTNVQMLDDQKCGWMTDRLLAQQSDVMTPMMLATHELQDAASRMRQLRSHKPAAAAQP